MAEGSEFEMYDGRRVKPLLKKIAKEEGKTYEQVKKVFIEKFAKGSKKRFRKICKKVFEDD